MDYRSSFSQLEEQAKLTATKTIAEMFQKYEQLDKVSQIKKRFKSQEEATEAQLKLAIHSQLDNVKDGLEKLDKSYTECRNIQGRIDEVSNVLINIKSLSNGLENLQEQSKKQKQLAAAMDNMDYLVNVPDKIKIANSALDNENYLNAHRLIEELEAIRDEIMRELYLQEGSQTDLHTLETFFRDVEKLNSRMVQHIHFIGERVINATVSQNVVLVNCIRIIDREERRDQLWLNRKSGTDFMPTGRPKKWKEEFFIKVKKCIHEKIFECALDEEQQKSYLSRHLEAIRLLTIADLKVIKNIGVVYFPPEYNVFDTFVNMFHEVICDYLEMKALEVRTDTEAFQLLSWINHYYSDEFFGSSELKIELKNQRNLLSTTLSAQVISIYLERNRTRLQSWLSNCVTKDFEDWMSNQLPQLDRDGAYNTSLSINVLKPLIEMIGENNCLCHLGEKVREKYFPMFLLEFENFQKNYIKQLYYFRDTCSKGTAYPYYLEYLVANCNNCLRIQIDLNDCIQGELKSSAILLKIDAQLQNISSEMVNIAQICLDLMKDLMFLDLIKVFSNIFTDEWIKAHYNVADYVLGTVADYDSTLMLLKSKARIRLYTSLIDGIVIEYIKYLFAAKRTNFSIDDRKRVGNVIYTDGDKIMEFFTKQMNFDKTLTNCAFALRIIGQLLNSDESMMRLDIDNLIRNFPGIRKDQMIIILMLRGDMKANEAREIATDYSYAAPNSNDIFTKVAVSMGL